MKTYFEQFPLYFFLQFAEPNLLMVMLSDGKGGRLGFVVLAASVGICREPDYERKKQLITTIVTSGQGTVASLCRCPCCCCLSLLPCSRHTWPWPWPWPYS